MRVQVGYIQQPAAIMAAILQGYAQQSDKHVASIDNLKRNFLFGELVGANCT